MLSLYVFEVHSCLLGTSRMSLSLNEDGITTPSLPQKVDNFIRMHREVTKESSLRPPHRDQSLFISCECQTPVLLSVTMRQKQRVGVFNGADGNG